MRRNFSQAVRTAAVKRATRDGVFYCEECKLPSKKKEVDHIIPDAMGGKPILSNAMALCLPCHAEKTDKHDKPAIAKAVRREGKHLGATAQKPPMQGRQFEKTEKKAKVTKVDDFPPLKYNALYRDAP